jgi:hypothetical protein
VVIDKLSFPIEHAVSCKNCVSFLLSGIGQNNRLFFQQQGTRTEQVHFTYNANSLIANRQAYRYGPQPKTKSDKSEMVNCSRNEFGSHRPSAQGSSFRQYIGAGINPVVPAFPIVPAFRSF